LREVRERKLVMLFKKKVTVLPEIRANCILITFAFEKEKKRGTKGRRDLKTKKKEEGGKYMLKTDACK